MINSVLVRAGCRLHFGMFSFGRAGCPQFGGVGMMIAPPNVAVRISPAAAFEATGDLAPRIPEFIRPLVESWQLKSLPRCGIHVESPPDHVGLGVGTQVGLAIAAGLRRFLDLPPLAAAELASHLGRGSRSSVGTYGFELGGLIVDAGKTSAGALGKLESREAMPQSWRIILARPQRQRGLAGKAERDAFSTLPPIPERVTNQLWDIVNEQMLPAVRNGDCAAFGEAVFHFGRIAGECFAAAQGGAFANDQVRETVMTIRGWGIPGVGQSSWGPTVFAVAESQDAAQEILSRLKQSPPTAGFELIEAQPLSSGAQVTVA